MDEAEAGRILEGRLAELRALPYSELVERYLDDTNAADVAGPSGAMYQLEIQAFWDDPRLRGGDLRVMVSIDDGRGWRAFSPLTRDFIMAPDGTFVGE